MNQFSPIETHNFRAPEGCTDHFALERPGRLEWQHVRDYRTVFGRLRGSPGTNTLRTTLGDCGPAREMQVCDMAKALTEPI
jgi:hypothetical protein